jgi:hypothetical protein
VTPRRRVCTDDERISPMPQNRTTSFAPAIATLLLTIGALAQAPAAHAVGLTRLELLNQSVRISGQSAVVGLGFRAQLSGGDLNEGFALMPVVEYWRDKDKATELGINELMQRDWRFGADVRYTFGDGVGWTPYAGAGLALHLIHSKSNVTFPGQGPLQIEDSDTNLAPNLLVGVDLPLAGRIRNSLELAYDMVPDLKQVKINFAIGYAFGPLPDDSGIE